MDKCGCCQVCGRTEHELCDLNPGEGKYGICGDNLACRRKVEVNTFGPDRPKSNIWKITGKISLVI